jgi:pimeloyl-ACP methyl ester carboxylesterase
LEGGEKMNKKFSSLFIALVIVALTVSPLIATVMAKRPVVTDEEGYTQYVGTLDGANYVIRIPDEWNGGLVVGCHGYMMDWNPDAQFQLDQGTLPWAFIEQGYAYAASSFGEGGFAVKMGMIRTHQLTEYVINNYGVTGKVFLCGVSMGGAIVLLLGEKYPELYDGVLDVVGLKDISNAYIMCDTLINSDDFPTFPAQMQAFLLSALADYKVECGGTVYDKPKAYERISPTCHADISIPTISVHGSADILVPLPHALLYEPAVAEAGCSEDYKISIVPGGTHGGPLVQAEALIRFDDLVNYPTGW